MRAARGALIALGVGLIGYGAFLLATEADPSGILGVFVWVGVAILVHDGVVAPVAVAVGLGAARIRDRVGAAGVAVAQGALLVGAVLTAITLPALIASLRGNANPTILVGSYGLALAGIWAVLIAVATIALRRSASAVARQEGDMPTK